MRHHVADHIIASMGLLVHQYADVDDRRVVEIVRTRLGDLDRYVEAVAGLLGADERSDEIRSRGSAGTRYGKSLAAAMTRPTSLAVIRG